MLPPHLLALWLATASAPAFAAKAGSFADGGNTQVSAMMMFVGNNEKVYILDKAEGNAAQVAGHSAWGAVWDINTHATEIMDVKTNVFCASGMHLPNGSYATFGGNGAVGPGGNIGSQKNPSGASGAWDETYQDFDGSKSIRIVNPCTDGFDQPNCQWFDDPTVLAMQKQRWYSTAEPLADGSIVMIGGFVNGGYVNRNFPNTDPEFEGGAAECTYEFFPSTGPAQTMQFMIKTSGLNSYAHTFLMPSGKMFLQANLSTILWDPSNNQETPLPDMPNGVIRVYPASGAVAMLPLTPANNYNPTILFCGGSNMPADSWGDYSHPAVNTWDVPASQDCQRITPEPTDGSAPTYQQDDDMLEGRTMGQFIILPDGKMMVFNGGLNGTAGYADKTGQTESLGFMPFGMSLAAGPVGTPAIYDPKADKGKRWTNSGFATSSIARLYHSSAILLPDASVLVAGSNPNVDVNTSTVYPTEYRAEIFYPSYFSATTRPAPTGIPKTLSYGGSPFDITVPASSYSGSANDAADSTIVALIRPGWTTHAMNMGQRYLQLNNTYTVNKDGSITLHVSQAPPKPQIFQPGPAWVYVVVNGVPSNGTYLIVGNGQIGTQPTSDAAPLPGNVRLDSASGSADGSSTSADGSSGKSSSGSTTSTGLIVGAVVGGIAVLGILGAVIGICLARRRRAATRSIAPSSYAMNHSGEGLKSGAAGYAGAGALTGGVLGAGHQKGALRGSDSSSFLPLNQQEYHQTGWSQSNMSLGGQPGGGYKDDIDGQSGRGSGMGMSMEYDPYAQDARMSPNPMAQRRY